MNATCHIARLPEELAALQAFVRSVLPDGDFRRICIKPNWVMHEEHPEFPVRALVTSPVLIHATVEACREKYPRLEWITVGDVPLQSCEWERLLEQCGLTELRAAYAAQENPRIRFLDLRRERFRRVRGYLVPDPAPCAGDPEGYREVLLDEASFLDPISTPHARFRVSDYDPGITTSSHRRGQHRYLVAGSALASDLFINLPKMKTHQKAGLTGALKNIVGINGQKAFLVHHRECGDGEPGDEFSPDTPWPIRLQVRVRDRLQKRSRFLFQLARPGWLLLKKLYGIRTEVTRAPAPKERPYVAAGSWYGNDTLWRMVYDLNRIIRFAPVAGGRLADRPQRAYLAIVDALVAGEGNGPLQPLPVECGRVFAGADPFLVDLVMARLMNFDARLIPCLSHHAEFGDTQWGAFDPARVELQVDGEPVTGLAALAPFKSFQPPPGWRGHIEAARP